MSEQFHCESERKPEFGAAVVRIVGRLTAASLDDFEKALLPLSADAVIGKIVLDGANLQYIASAGLRGLLKAIKELEKHGGKLYAVNLSKNVASVLKMTGFFPYVEIRSSVEDCLK